MKGRTIRRDEKFIGTNNASMYLGITPRHLRRLVKEGKVKAYMPLGRHRFQYVDLDAYRDRKKKVDKSP